MLLMVLLVFYTAPVQHVFAEPVEPLDFCIGVDHPPFEMDYPGDGYSYLRVGLTLPLTAYSEGDHFTGELSGGSGPVSSESNMNADGQLFFAFPLYGYGAYTVAIYDGLGEMVFQNDVTVDQTETLCDPDDLKKAPPVEEPAVIEEPTSTEPTVTEPETPEETPEVIDEPSEPVAVEDSTNWWPVLIIAGGGLLVLVGVLMLLKKNCEKERKAWLEAEQVAKAAREAARQAEAAAEELTEAREQLEAELKDIREVYPSAGKPGGEEAWIEMDGKRITSRDVAMKREAEKAAWEEYRSDPNHESAEQLQEDWEEILEPQSEEERRDLDEAAKQLEESIKEAKSAEKEGKKQAEKAQKAEQKAEAAAEAARLAYEACIKAALAPPKPKPTKPETPEGPDTGGPSISDNPQESSCCKSSDPPQERNRRLLGRVSIPIKLKVNIEGGGAHEGAEAANDISDQLADASEKLGWISKAMDIKGIGETLVRDGAGWSLLGAAGPPAAGQALDVPVPTSPGQLAVDTLSLLGKISSVIIKKVPELQERRLPDCDLSASIVNHVFTAECVEIWVCKNGQWVKDRSRFTLTLIQKSSGRMTKRRGLTWAQAQRHIRRYESIYRSRLRNGLNRLAELESRCR